MRGQVCVGGGAQAEGRSIAGEIGCVQWKEGRVCVCGLCMMEGSTT